jgi:hypothetical protein
MNWGYYDTDDKKAFIYDGSAWQTLVQDGATGPQGLPGTDGKSLIWKGSLASAPPSPSENWAYHNTNDSTSYIYNGTSWQVLTRKGAKGAPGTPGTPITWAGTWPSHPATALNKAYYNSSDRKSYVWDGDSWETLAVDGADGVDGTDGVDGIGIIWKGSLPEPPSSPQTNWAYHNTSDSISYIFNGTWQVLAQKGARGPRGTSGYDIPGSLGQTLRHNGTEWVSSSLLYNDQAASRIGINTTTPSQTLDVNGNTRLGGHIYDNSNSPGSEGQVLTRGASGVLWQNATGSITGTG